MKPNVCVRVCKFLNKIEYITAFNSSYKHILIKSTLKAILYVSTVCSLTYNRMARKKIII